MVKELEFASREDFRKWLEENGQKSEGVWLRFGKAGGPKTVKAGEALEEALCFGWIDSQMKSTGDKTYIKYFSPRRKKTEWSAKNIALVDKLEKDGQMTEFGRAKIEEAKRDGCFKPKQRPEVTEERIQEFIEKIKGHEPAYTNLMAMSPSVRRTYTGFSLDVKSEEAAKKRLEKIIDRLNNNLKPM